MAIQCDSPGCRHVAQPGGQHCLDCASKRRLALQRKRRGHAYPAGALPPEEVAALLAQLEELRDVVDAADHRRFAFAGEANSEASVLLQETMQQVRALVLRMREPLIGWNALNAIQSRAERE